MLTIQRPTPSTVLYTVSTKAANNTLTARLWALQLALLRILLALAVLLVLTSIYTETITPANTPNILTTILKTLPGRLALTITHAIPFPWQIPIALATLWLVSRKGYTTESLLVVRGLGVQTSTSSPSYLWPGSTRFIPTTSVQDIFIHEAFQGFEVKFYLCIVVDGEEDVVVVFPVSSALRFLEIYDVILCFAENFT